MNPESQSVSEAYYQMDIESGVKMVDQFFAQMDPEDRSQMFVEVCVQMNPESRAQMFAEVCAQMNPEACAQMIGDVCAQMDPRACAQRITNAYVKMNPEARARMIDDVCAEVDPQSCAQMIYKAYAQKFAEGCAQINPKASAQTEHCGEGSFVRGYTGSTDIDRTHPSVSNRITASRYQVFTKRRVEVVRDLRCPLYVFAADLVRFVMRCYHGSNYRDTFEFTDAFAHASLVTHLSPNLAFVLRKIFDGSQALIHATYAQYVVRSPKSEAKLKNRMDTLRNAVEIGCIRTFVDLINFCFFVGNFCAIAYYYEEIQSAPYMALDVVYWNMVRFVRIILGSDLNTFWLIMPLTCDALEHQEREKIYQTLFHKLCRVMLDPAKMSNPVDFNET